jgi:hypothetical protein
MNRKAALRAALLAAMALACLATRASPAPAEAKGDDAVVATVGGERIVAGEVKRLLAKATGGKPASAAAEPVLRAQALEEAVARRLVLAYARRCGEAATAAEIDAALADLKTTLRSQHRTIEDFLKSQSIGTDDLRRQLAWNVVWQRYLARYVTPARSAAYFQAHRRELDGSRLAVSHILLRPAAGAEKQTLDAVMKRAEEIRGEIAAGKISFAAAAEKYSAGPSAKQGGRLGEIGRHGAMGEAFSRAAFALDVGGVSPPVRTPFGVHLIRCEAVRPGGKQLADVRKEVEDALARELLEKLAALERRSTAVEYSRGVPHFQPGTHELAAPRTRD